MSSSNVNHLSWSCIYDGKSMFLKGLSRFFKCALFELGNYIQILWCALRPSNRRVLRGGKQPQSFGNENTANKEKEELDSAIALSLTKDLKKPNENDEDLSRTLNGLSRLCSGCEREIDGNCVGGMGMFYHPECFRCHACRCPITEREVAKSGRDIYHISCYKELIHPKCEVCHQSVPTNGVDLIEYRCNRFWLQKYCPSHEHDNTARCCSCERFESWNTRHISRVDGCSICLECMESAIMDTDDCQLLYHSIRDFFEGISMKIGQQIPILLVERHALNEAIEGEKHGYHRPETRGLCIYQEPTVTSKRPSLEGSGFVGIRTQPHELIPRGEVTAILILCGLPRLLTGSILAHELMHGWLHLNGYRNLATEVGEGICQLLSHMWLESEVLPETRNMPSLSSTSSSSMTWSYGSTSTPSTSSSSSPWSSSKQGGRSSVENKLGNFFMHQIANETSAVYGDGFRAAMAAVKKYGLHSTLNHIRNTGSFPK